MNPVPYLFSLDSLPTFCTHHPLHSTRASLPSLPPSLSFCKVHTRGRNSDSRARRSLLMRLCAKYLCTPLVYKYASDGIDANLIFSLRLVFWTSRLDPEFTICSIDIYLLGSMIVRIVRVLWKRLMPRAKVICELVYCLQFSTKIMRNYVRNNYNNSLLL